MKGVVRSPRWKLGAVLAVVTGVVTHLVLGDIWITLFLGAAFWGLVTFGAIGRGGDGDDMWTGD